MESSGSFVLRGGNTDFVNGAFGFKESTEGSNGFSFPSEKAV